MWLKLKCELSRCPSTAAEKNITGEKILSVFATTFELAVILQGAKTRVRVSPFLDDYAAVSLNTSLTMSNINFLMVCRDITLQYIVIFISFHFVFDTLLIKKLS